MSDDSTHSRRSVLRTVGLSAGSVAFGAVGTAGADASCDGATETTVEEGALSGASSADTLTHTTQLDDPCEVVFSLSSVEPTDFDLYLTLDGRIPTTEDFDRKSMTAFTSGETITLGESALSGSGSFGVLVDSYTAGGSYRLEITETATGEEEEPNESPRAAFSVSPSSPTVGETVTVDASASTDPDGTVAGYDWAFGDGSTASGQTATTTYDDAGEYTVELTVTDSEGATDTTAKGVTVEPDDDGGRCGRTVTTTETGTLSGRGDDDAISYGVRTAEPCEVTLSLSGDAGTDFDLYLTYDGRTPTTRDYDERSYNYGSDEEIVADPDLLGGDTELGVLVNSYSGAGDYELLIEEVGGGQAPNEPPTARIDVSPAEPTVGETVTLSGTDSTDPDGSVTGYEWTLDGNRVSTEPTDSFTFDEPGEYTAGLTVTDDDGATDTTSATLTVAAGGGSCGDERETASASDVLYGYYGGDTYTYDTRTTEPCRATFTLDGPDGADFDLYLTLDGRTPTTRDYDVRSVSPGPDEEIVLDEIDASTSVGILVEPASGYGRYTIDVEELGT